MALIGDLVTKEFKSFWDIPNARVREAYVTTLGFAEHTHKRAYVFLEFDDGLLEVRVWPDGKYTLTACDEQGLPK